MKEEVFHFVSNLVILAAAEIFVDSIYRAKRGITVLEQRDTTQLQYSVMSKATDVFEFSQLLRGELWRDSEPPWERLD